MKISAPSLVVLALASFALIGCDQRADPVATRDRTPAPTNQGAPAVDNTGRNRADAPSDLTAIDQSNSSNAVAATAAIRQAIMDDSSMSTMAQNCKIITDKNGVVTLRGPVATQIEKDSIGAKAKAVANVTRVVNELEVKAI